MVRYDQHGRGYGKALSEYELLHLPPTVCRIDTGELLSIQAARLFRRFRRQGIPVCTSYYCPTEEEEQAYYTRTEPSEDE